MTNGQKKPTKSVAFFDPQPRNLSRPVIDFLGRLGGEALRRVILAETANYPSRHRRPLPSGDDIPLEYHADGFPMLPTFLDRRTRRL